MASDKQQWNHAVERWQRLFKEEAFSVSPHLGRTAIICSNYSSEGSSVEGFKDEAHALADNLTSWGGHPEVLIGPTAGDVTTVIQDPRVASIVTIGDGTLSSLILGPKTSPPNPECVYSWKNVSDATTHLKLGLAEQRQSGLMQRALNVPLCLFAMADHSNVMAYLGIDFQPKNLYAGINLELAQVSIAPVMSKRQVDALPRLPFTPPWRYEEQLKLLAP